MLVKWECKNNSNSLKDMIRKLIQDLLEHVLDPIHILISNDIILFIRSHTNKRFSIKPVLPQLSGSDQAFFKYGDIFMISKDEIVARIAVRDSEGEKDKYQKIIQKISEGISNEISKNKRLLLITGAGISSGGEKSVPGMEKLLEKIENLVKEFQANYKLSQEFGNIFKEYEASKDTDNKHDSQSKLLTYIQNAYMQKSDYVQPSDLEPLRKLWIKFVFYLLTQVLAAEPTDLHKSITNLMIEINEADHPTDVKNQAIVLTTNFDNMLKKEFDEHGKTFYPILDREALDLYYTSSEEDNSYIEIQSRGDVFWMECCGDKNRTCTNRKKQILLPHNTSNEITDITCPLCGSKALVYFAFPGTKEKDAEMATVVDGLWKFISTSVSTIIVVGSSLDYDPVLIEFMRELARRYNIRFVYISRYKEDDPTPNIKEKIVPLINEKKATDFLFGSNTVSDSYWLLAKKTNLILNDILNEYRRVHSKTIKLVDDRDNLCDACLEMISMLYAEKKDKIRSIETLFRSSFPENATLLEFPELQKLKKFSQLGMKTYWLREDGDSLDYKLHTRYKHSFGVMLIATYIYLKKVEKPSYNEMTFLQLAALLHDIGHLPYSHLMEEVFNEFGWKLSFSDKTYSHEQNTKLLLDEMYNKDDSSNKLKPWLDKINYTCSDLQRLISGEFGVGYLDALINSPIDCDKIEYLFTDTMYTRNDRRYKIDDFLNDFVCNDLRINSTGNILISGKSTRAFLKLIDLRGEMYENTYYRSGLRFLESCTKLIIRTFFSYFCAEDKVFTDITNQERYPSFKDLSECKIQTAVKYLKSVICKEGVCEKAIIEDMYKQIEEKYNYSMNSIKECLKNCKDKILNTNKSTLSTIESTRIRIFEVKGDIDKNQLRNLIKHLYLRFPGVVLIDYIESKSSFSFGKRDNGILRSDGTSSPNENIMIKDIKQIKGYKDSKYICIGDAINQVNNELKYSTHSYIYLHRITDNRFSYMQAEDLIIDELRKDGIIDV